MNWTELKRYASLTDIKKFIKYASENMILPSESSDSDSFFCNIFESRERVLDNIMEYDFFDLDKIEQLFGKSLKNSKLSNIDVLLRITAAAMLKNKPREIGLRERNKVSEAVKPEFECNESEIELKNDIGKKPPQFYYPM